MVLSVVLLPETTRTPLGFTVEGASAELLEQLLDEYAFQLKRHSRKIFDAMIPGLSRAQIEDELAAIGKVPPDEMLVWWQWRNGFQVGFGHGLRHAQMSLSTAIALYKQEHLGTEETNWNPEWLLVAGTGNHGVAMCCRSSEPVPRVRSVSTFEIGTQDSESTAHQVLSLCTPIAWRLLAIAKGWDEFEPLTEMWGWDDSRYPLERKLTNLM